MKHLKKIKQVLKKYNFQGSPNEVAFCHILFYKSKKKALIKLKELNNN